MSEKLDTWTVTAQFTVFAGDMETSEVVDNAIRTLIALTDGSDMMNVEVISAERDTY